MTNKEAINILKLMPKQSDAIKKAIEVLESENYYKSLAESYGDTINKLTAAISEMNKWHTEPPKKNGRYLIWWCDNVEIARYTDNLYKVNEYDFAKRKRAGWYKYDSDYGYYELDNVKAWQELPSDYKESEEKGMKEILDIIHKTICQFFDKYDGETPISDKDELLLEVNKAITNNIKALEQEPILDKIRAEIIAMRIKHNVGALECLSIIDKYREEQNYDKRRNS